MVVEVTPISLRQPTLVGTHGGANAVGPESDVLTRGNARDVFAFKYGPLPSAEACAAIVPSRSPSKYLSRTAVIVDVFQPSTLLSNPAHKAAPGQRVTLGGQLYKLPVLFAFTVYRSSLCREPSKWYHFQVPCQSPAR